ncbi:MAG TPA: helix-turn-helix domain-containing protein [Azospirillum sp.]|nr:helix-turn-helix domain-containing protein [Azospirillum sp.]
MTGRRTAAAPLTLLPPATPAPATPYVDLIDRALPPCRPLPPSMPTVPADDAAFLDQLGERVRAARNRQGLTRKALARLSGVSERHLAQLETGRGNISILLLRRVAQAMNAPLCDLVREEEAALQPAAAGDSVGDMLAALAHLVRG